MDILARGIASCYRERREEKGYIEEEKIIKQKGCLMTVSTSRLMFKGLEEEVYTGLPDGQIVGISERIDKSLPGFQTEPDLRNPEFALPPLQSYDEIGTTLVRVRSRLRDWLQCQGSYTLIPGATMSMGDSNVFLISDPNNEYYKFIRNAYGTRVVTTSTHISIGLDDAETIIRAARLLRAEACLFLALTAASPFLDGEVTGQHSTRWLIFPHTPVTVPLFESQREYELFVDEAISDGRMQSNRHLWVSARPNGPNTPHHLNRAELRICDQIYDPRIALGVAALAEARIHQMKADPSLDPLVASELPASTRADDLLELIEENEAAVAKHSLVATVRHWRDGRLLPVRDWLDTYLAGALATAKPLGFGQYLQPLWQIVNRGNVAMQWLEQHKRGASIPEIMGRYVIAMRKAEMSYAENTPCTETSPGDSSILTLSKRLQPLGFGDGYGLG
jgi:predicted glutamate--cysteine ligase